MKKLILLILGLLSIPTFNYPCCGDGGWGLGLGLFGATALTTAAIAGSRRPRETVIYQKAEPDDEAIQKAYQAGEAAEKQRLDAYKAGIAEGKKQALGA